jgi:hypothetical protein
MFVDLYLGKSKAGEFMLRALRAVSEAQMVFLESHAGLGEAPVLDLEHRTLTVPAAHRCEPALAILSECHPRSRAEFSARRQVECELNRKLSCYRGFRKFES